MALLQRSVHFIGTLLLVSACFAASSPTAVADAASLRTFRLAPEQTEARFFIHEDLFGIPNTVVGVTSQVAGELRVDLRNPNTLQVGILQINARDLKTDNRRRNRYLHSHVLESDRDGNRLITFEPKALEGLPESVSIGKPFQFRMSGDLTIHGTTRMETFTLSVTVISETELHGIGSTTVRHADFGLTIPNVRIVANVAETVRLEIEFTAVAIDEAAGKKGANTLRGEERKSSDKR